MSLSFRFVAFLFISLTHCENFSLQNQNEGKEDGRKRRRQEETKLDNAQKEKKNEMV